jgi:hypothetical protein
MILTNDDILKKKILESSLSKDWETAKKEWRVVDITISSTPSKCLCGHSPITKLCEIVNNSSGIVEIVGSCCLKKFMDSKSEQIVKSFKKLDGKIKALPKSIIDLAKEYRIITSWERNFYLKMGRRTNLNSMEIEKKRDIESRIKQFFIE